MLKATPEFINLGPCLPELAISFLLENVVSPNVFSQPTNHLPWLELR